MDIQALVSHQINKVKKSLKKEEQAYAEILFRNNECQVLSQSAQRFELMVKTPGPEKITEYAIVLDKSGFIPFRMGKSEAWNRFSLACLLRIRNELSFSEVPIPVEHKKYAREGMIRRVLAERRQKAETANYSIKWADNIYGDHLLTNENGTRYKIFLRDFEAETGYSDSMDSRLNRLGTTKHLMFAFRKLKEDKKLYESLDKTFPFIEIFCDPLNDYRISWYYPSQMPLDEFLLVSLYFKKANAIEHTEARNFLGFINDAREFPLIRIRPEVQQKVEVAFEDEVLANLKTRFIPDFSEIKANLYPYQKEGVTFALFRKTAIIADEMGLGKTIQAIATAIQKKQLFDFQKTLIVCPASLKEQWKKEIETFTNEKAVIVQGSHEERIIQYNDYSSFFFIVNYETIMRDQVVINSAGFDFLILDEAQRIKNYETKTASAISHLKFKHVLVITGTPIENRLIDLFSVLSAINPYFLGPLWEFSYQHCLFDPEKPNKINGYYNLQKLNKRLDTILLRREKKEVMHQLPEVQEVNIPVNLSPLQQEYHASFARGISAILKKKYLTPFDLQKLQLLLANMRMVCDSTFLIDNETNESPKLDELRYMLLDKMDIANSNHKIIIFSEWIKVHKLIGRMLDDNNIGFVELNGNVPVKLRGELIRKFETNPHCKIFLSTETGGTGLNLQVANTLINFEIPWNPAKKNQRIGRIDRIGQKSNHLSVYNLVARNSIEQQISAGLILKQNLFDSVLNQSNDTNFIDFSSKGRAQFIQQLEEFILKAAEAPVPDSDYKLLENIGFQANSLSSDLESINPESEPDEFQSEISTSPGVENTDRISKEKAVEMQQVMNNGMQFLAGLFKMSTGQDIGMEGNGVEIDSKTGEVLIRFKLQ